ncbi:MAG: hypothetical protein NT040_03805 [Bacteroidetes bacterium]|nr:hypothetical protein [Bacteroidota bacterium]
MKRQSLLVVMVFIAFSCTTDSWDSSLQIRNRSKRTIIYVTTTDTAITRFNTAEYYLGKPIPADSVKRATLFNNDWNHYIDVSYNKKLNIYFFDADTIKKYMNMDYIVGNNLFIKKMEITKTELEKRKFIINVNQGLNF